MCLVGQSSRNENANYGIIIEKGFIFIFIHLHTRCNIPSTAIVRNILQKHLFHIFQFTLSDGEKREKNVD